jgi:hypothetical protein
MYSICVAATRTSKTKNNTFHRNGSYEFVSEGPKGNSYFKYGGSVKPPRPRREKNGRRVFFTIFILLKMLFYYHFLINKQNTGRKKCRKNEFLGPRFPITLQLHLFNFPFLAIPVFLWFPLTKHMVE